MKLDELSPELKEKVLACKTPDELMALAKEEGHELSSEELEAISGGGWSCWDVCSSYEECGDRRLGNLF